MYSKVDQEQYILLLATANSMVQEAKQKAENQLNAAKSAYKKSNSQGEAAVNKYVEYEKDYDATSAMQYYISHYLETLLRTYTTTGIIDRFNSEWHNVYQTIKTNLLSITRSKNALDKQIQDIILKGGTPSSSKMDELSDLDDEMHMIDACKLFHELLFDLAFNYNSQITRHSIGSMITATDVGGNQYVSCIVESIVQKSGLKIACPSVPLEDVLKTLPEDYRNPNPDFTLFYVIMEPITYSEPTTDPDTGEEIPGEPNPPVYHIVWDEMLYGH